jgi:hypothetical protein
MAAGLKKRTFDVIALENIRVEFFPADKAVCASCAYLETDREKGSGPFRINTCIVPNADIYSLLLSSQFRPEIVDKHRVKSKLRDEAEV